MTDREKLMGLIDELQPHEGKTFEQALADHLIANGVEIYNKEDEKVLKMARQRAMEEHGNLRYLQGVQFGVESATKHGRWIPCENGGYYCSNCDARVAFIVHNKYCPACGTRMDGATDG